MNDYGVLTAPDTVRLERILPGPIERVWTYLTDSDKRATWFAGGAMDLRAGGEVALVFRNSQLTTNDGPPPPDYANHGGEMHMLGEITECDPPRRLSFTFGGAPGEASEVTFELTPREDEVMLVLTHRRIATRSSMVSFSGGWHTHIGILRHRLEDRDPPGFWTTFTRLEAEYQKRIPAAE